MWDIELDGKTYTSGISPASGLARFNDLSHAAEFAVANYHAACVMRHDQRRRERAALTLEAGPSPG